MRQNKQIPFRLTSASNYNKYSSLSLYRWIKSQSADSKATSERLLMIHGSKNSCEDVICPLYRERNPFGKILKIRVRWRNIHVSLMCLSQWARENFDSYCKNYYCLHVVYFIFHFPLKLLLIIKINVIIKPNCFELKTIPPMQYLHCLIFSLENCPPQHISLADDSALL